MSAASTPFITPDALLAHWQGHRRLTRRVIDAFPDEKLFTFSSMQQAAHRDRWAAAEGVRRLPQEVSW